MSWPPPSIVANQHGDLFGTSPQRIIRSGHVSIEDEYLQQALDAGWRLKGPGDPGYHRIVRRLDERP